MFLAIAILAAGCGEKREPASSTGELSKEAPAAAKIVEDYAKTLSTAPKRAAITVDLVSVKKAVDQFQAMEGRLPASIKELIAERYLLQVPVVPNGMRLQYDPKTGAVAVVPQ